MHLPAKYRIEIWCHSAGIGRTLLFALWREGRGPRSIRLGRRRLITEEPDAFFARCAEAANRGNASNAPPREAVEPKVPPADKLESDKTPHLDWPSSALRAWDSLPRDPGIAIITVRWHSAREATVLTVMRPVQQSKARHHAKRN